MTTTAEQHRLPRRTLRPQDGAGTLRGQRQRSVLLPWLRGQAINVTRHAAALRPFTRTEFGTDSASPTEGHVEAVNKLIVQLRENLLKKASKVTQAVGDAREQGSTRNLQAVVTYKERAHDWVRAVERVWDFYFELFGQRQSRFADWLLSCDRIALDCYQVAFMGVSVPKSIPAPPPFSYMRTGFSPATFRRGIPLRKLGMSLNPFPLIQLPYHRLVNPWTLGAILHEVSHNTQNDMGLHEIIPRQIGARLLREGLPRSVAAVWVRWNRETFADLSGLLLGGPAVVASLMDIIGRSPKTVVSYSPRGPHPTPYVRAFISFELMRRMGFPEKAEAAGRAWTRCYPNPQRGTIPRAVLATAERAIRVVVDAICYTPYATLGGKCLAQVIQFGPKEQLIVEEASRRLAAGNDPGIVPERFLIGAARYAFDRRMARPQVIQENFYKELARR
ncbi:MAG TPA: hypothetical protein VM936_02325 [Pyrinomonadaceae bacterium]|nr:hypothetical protein [Pyrinomonadaceae bacterium]